MGCAVGCTVGCSVGCVVGALFQNLGRMLSQFYFPEEAASIRALVTAPKDAVPEQSASTRVLGMSFEALGVGVAKSWGLPEGIQRCMLGFYAHNFFLLSVESCIVLRNLLHEVFNMFLLSL